MPSGNHLVDRLYAEMRRGYIDVGEEICLDCGKVNCTCDDEYERSRDDD